MYNHQRQANRNTQINSSMHPLRCGRSKNSIAKNKRAHQRQKKSEFRPYREFSSAASRHLEAREGSRDPFAQSCRREGGRTTQQQHAALSSTSRTCSCGLFLAAPHRPSPRQHAAVPRRLGPPAGPRLSGFTCTWSAAGRGRKPGAEGTQHGEAEAGQRRWGAEGSNGRSLPQSWGCGGRLA